MRTKYASDEYQFSSIAFWTVENDNQHLFLYLNFFIEIAPKKVDEVGRHVFLSETTSTLLGAIKVSSRF